MIVVSDTSPVINLAAVGELELLEKLYTRILVPEAVYHEVVVIGTGQLGSQEVQTWPCFEVRVVQNQAFVADLMRELDAGEAEAIALAVEWGGSRADR
jgi:predicted nucleic acid-binding protein